MGKAFFSLVILLSVCVAAPAALAREGCETSLRSGLNRPVINEKSHVISDFEDLYLTIVETTAELSSLEGDLQYAKLKELLNLKVYFLNQILGVARIVTESDANYDLSPSQVNDMILSLGVPAHVFGDYNKWGVKDDIAVETEGLREEEHTPPKSSPLPIGFDVGIDHQSVGEPALPDGHSRSIGFRDFEIHVEAPPLRPGGRIWVMPSLSRQSLAIIDMQNEKSWTVLIDFAFIMKIANEHEVLAIDYNSDIGEWIVLRENLANPSGVIGFQARRPFP